MLQLNDDKMQQQKILAVICQDFQSDYFTSVLLSTMLFIAPVVG